MTFKNKSGDCIECGKGGLVQEAYETSEQECMKCPNCKYEDGKCLLKECPQGEFKRAPEVCQPCDDRYIYESEEKDCIKCPNREYKNGYCRLKECPPKTFKNKWGSCIRCDEDVAVNGDASSEQECVKCPDRHYSDGKCVLEEKEYFVGT